MRLVVPRRAAACAALAALLVAGCSTTATQSHVTELRRASPDPKILLMPLDVELMEMDMGGVLEPKPEWTAAARRFITEEVRAERSRLGFRLEEFPEEFPGPPEEQELIDQLVKVHAAVGRAMRTNRKPLQELRSLGEKPRWSLGEDVQVLRKRTGADYALFVHVRDSYASDGRKLVMLAGAALRTGILGGVQSGFASLVDLQTGDIVWSNQLGRVTGDLRTREPATETVRILLKDFPA
jgi:hypothetical protein